MNQMPTWRLACVSRCAILPAALAPPDCSVAPQDKLDDTLFSVLACAALSVLRPERYAGTCCNTAAYGKHLDRLPPVQLPGYTSQLNSELYARLLEEVESNNTFREIVSAVLGTTG